MSKLFGKTDKQPEKRFAVGNKVLMKVQIGYSPAFSPIYEYVEAEVIKDKDYFYLVRLKNGNILEGGSHNLEEL